MHPAPAPNPPDILYLVHRVPYPPDKGDRIRSYHVLRFLARRAAVHLACFADEPITDEVVSELQTWCKRLTIIPLAKVGRWVRALGSFVRGRTISEGAFGSAAMRATLHDWLNETRFQGVLASASSMVPYLRMKELRDIPAVVDLMDVDSQKWFDYAGRRPWPLSWLFRTEGRRLRRVETNLPQWAKAVTLVSEAEAGLFRSFCPFGESHAVTNGVDLHYFQPDSQTASSKDCVFVAALDYYPNVDAALWFCREVWPEIHRRRPQSRFCLVGRRPVPAVQRLADVPGVKLIGQVPDVRPYLAGAAVAVVPLRIARGLQNKVLEALAMGKAVVASPSALAALKTRPGEHLLSASSPPEWIRAILGLLEDDEQRGQLGAAGRRYSEQHHDWDRCLERFQDLLGLSEKGTGPLEPVFHE